MLQHMLDHMLTMHVRSRRFKSMEDTVLFVKAVTALYDLYSESKSQQKLQVSVSAWLQANACDACDTSP